MIECTVNSDASVHYLRIQGEITISSVSDAKALLKSTLENLTPGQLKLDMGGVSEVDSSGVQLLLCMSRSLAQSGMNLSICACSDSLICTASELDLADEHGCIGVPYQVQEGALA